MNDIQKIVQKAKEGDSEAFALLYSEYYVPVYRYIFIRVKKKELAEDLTQDVFLKIYRSIETLSPQAASPLGYFYTIARNTLIDHWRKKTVVTESGDEYMDTVPDPSPNALEMAKLKEESSILHECLQKLTDEQREVVTLRYINDLSNREIAEIVGKNEAAVRQLQVRGLRSLSKVFKQRYGN